MATRAGILSGLSIDCSFRVLITSLREGVLLSDMGATSAIGSEGISIYFLWLSGDGRRISLGCLGIDGCSGEIGPRYTSKSRYIDSSGYYYLLPCFSGDLTSSD